MARVEVVAAPSPGSAAVVGRLELGDDAGQALGDGVVDLGGQAPAFVGDARLPGLDEELGVQAGVLVEGLLADGELVRSSSAMVATLSLALLPP